MKVLITAIADTGDLWLFNAARLICEQNGSTYGAKFEHYRPEEASGYDFQIIKIFCWDLDLSLESVIISTTRDPFTFKMEPGDIVAKYFTHSLYCAGANLVLEYEKIKNEPLSSINSVAHAMDLVCRADLILAELQKIKAPSRGYDSKTLLSKGEEL